MSSSSSSSQEAFLRLLSSIQASTIPSTSSSTQSFNPLLFPFPSNGNNNQMAQALLFNALLTSIQNQSVTPSTSSSIPSSSSSSSRPRPGSYEESLALLIGGINKNGLEQGEIPKRTNHIQQLEVHDSSKPRRPPLTDPSIVRIPLSNGWKRQTYIKEMNSFGVKGDVIYYAPCGKKLASYSEVVRYLAKNNTGAVNRDQFTFSSKIIVGEFYVVTKGANGLPGVVQFSEADVNTELKRLQDERMKKMEEERVKRELPLREKKEAIRREKEERKEMKKKEREEKEKNQIDKDRIEDVSRRKPIEDLLLEEIRPLPSFSRINNLELNGESFANLLMVHQFMNNFKLTLELDTVPSISDLSSGISGDSIHYPIVSSTVSTLLSRCITLLPQSRTIHTVSGNRLNNLRVDGDNRDELLRLFLSTCDGDGQQLSQELTNTSFISLNPSQKSSVLATLVNQLVCCRAVTSQIDGHMEVLSKLKGDRWMKEGKIRALRNVQDKRKKKDRLDDDIEMDGDRPNSRHSEHSNQSRPSTPIKKDIRFTPGIGQCEILTPEEEAMDDDTIESFIGDLSKQSDELSSSIQSINTRIRVFPMGEDRYHRLYWQLPYTLPLLVESIESGHTINNPSCDLSLIDEDPTSIKYNESIDPDVIGCLEDIIDRVVEGKIDIDRRRRTTRRMGNSEKRGWWSVSSNDMDQWKANLHGRGIRERCLHRILLKNKFHDEHTLGELTVAKKSSSIDKEEEEMKSRRRLSQKITELEYILLKGELINKKLDGDRKDTVDSMKYRLLALQEAINPKYFSVDHIDKEIDENNEEGEKKEDPIELWRRMTSQVSNLQQLALSAQIMCSYISWPLSLWQCTLCLFPSSSSSFVQCSQCPQRIHKECISFYSYPRPFRCHSCLPIMNPTEKEEDEDDEEEKKEERKGIKRRAEPNSFIVPSTHVAQLARSMLDELEMQKGIDPFLLPVDINEVPSYGLLIEKPMDLGTIRKRVDSGWYESADDFYEDVELVFKNCHAFNLDESQIGEAGHRIHRFFTKRWRQLKYNLSKRVKRKAH